MISKFPKLPSIIAVQEIWFSSDLKQIYNIFDYNAVHCWRQDRYGGTSVYINKDIDYKIDSCESKNFIESISLENIMIMGKPMKFSSFYRS